MVPSYETGTMLWQSSWPWTLESALLLPSSVVVIERRGSVETSLSLSLSLAPSLLKEKTIKSPTLIEDKVTRVEADSAN
jgi:hypothetical protein